LFLNTSANTIGVGTNAPASKFDVRGTMQVGVDDTGYDVKFYGDTAGAHMSWSTSGEQLELRGAAGSYGKLLISSAELTVVDGDKLGQINFQAPAESSGTDANNVAASIWAEADDTFATDNNATELVFATAASETATEKVRITSDGKVGIGSAAPTALLNVSGTCALGSGADVSGGHVAIKSDGTGTDGAFFVANSGGTALMKILDNGKVGIGTSAPGHMLVAKGLAGTSPTFEMINSDTEDGDTSRETSLRFSGFRSGGEAMINAQIGGHHDGSADDDKGMLLFATNSGSGHTERMRIDSSGKVGIGTTAPSGFTPSLTVYGTQPAISVGLNSTNFWQTHLDSGIVTTFFDDAAYWRIGSATNSGNSSFSEKVRIDGATGNMTINATHNALYKLNVIGETTSSSYALFAGAVSGSNTNHAAQFGRGGGNHQGSGIYIGGANYTTGDNAAIQLMAGGYSGSGYIYIKCHDNSGSDFYVRGDGYIYASGNFNTSDERLKKNIVSMKSNNDDGLKAINQLNPVRFDWKNPDKGSNKMGLIAQEVEPIIPEAVGWSDGNEYYTQADVDAANTDENDNPIVDEDGNPIEVGLSDGAKIGDLKHESQWGDKGKASVDYQHIQTHLIKAIQDLSAKVTALENA
jgi:hypothetical protein